MVSYVASFLAPRGGRKEESLVVPRLGGWGLQDRCLLDTAACRALPKVLQGRAQMVYSLNGGGWEAGKEAQRGQGDSWAKQCL